MNQLMMMRSLAARSSSTLVMGPPPKPRGWAISSWPLIFQIIKHDDRRGKSEPIARYKDGEKCHQEAERRNVAAPEGIRYEMTPPWLPPEPEPIVIDGPNDGWGVPMRIVCREEDIPGMEQLFAGADPADYAGAAAERSDPTFNEVKDTIQPYLDKVRDEYLPPIYEEMYPNDSEPTPDPQERDGVPLAHDRDDRMPPVPQTD